ncbi:N-acetyl sugar amidotransferase [Cohnella phaseoli]|uniref:N-acetyl sugar amidotransferase n=1 Tax=Cohnella phaseoli TaxID=456490 RepID=A0A3D9KCL1_9BACL|nr:N-acetyl sugar amidotransferase [Cohnella phaseoli]RED84033.1 N-acetyl sugar amidotransferase [Cohnella phaseoli]
MMKRDLRKLYNLPEEIRYCKKCTISNQRPRITFDEHGVCSACNYAEFKRTKVDWDLREKELIEMLDRHRKSDGSYDVIVPCSGGKDGSYVAHQLKYKYGMNPLTVTWAPHIPTDIGRANLQSFIQSGFDNILGTPNGKTHRLMTNLAFNHLGDPFQPFIYGQTNFPLKVAIQNNVSLIMYGENGEVEYGGDMKNAFRPTREIADHDKHYFSGLPPEFWKDHGVTDSDIHPYLAPQYEQILKNKTEIHFYGYYKFWDPQENYYYCVENTGFSANPERSQGTYSKYASLDDKIDGFHYFLGYIKFGIGRCTSDTAHEIRDGKITREEGVALVQKYDGEFPSKYYKEFLEYVNITEEQFERVVDSWRSDHIWLKSGNDWKLKSAVWEQ